jgi:UDP-glucuronate decarboxylase
MLGITKLAIPWLLSLSRASDRKSAGGLDSMTNTRVLLTGGSGFIGRWSVGPLLALGADVHTLQRHAVQVTDVVTHAVDLHDFDAVAKVVRQVQPTHLLHFAWIATPGVYLTSLDNPSWLRSSLQLVEAFLASGGRRVVVAGTAAEYDWSAGVCSERTKCSPATLYAACKHAQYEVLERWSVQQGFSFAAGRLFWAYGPEESPDRLVPAMIRASTSRTPLQLGHPDRIRDYLYVADAGAAFSALLASDVQGAVNIGSGEGVALSRLAELVGEETGEGLILEPGVANTDDPAPVVLAEATRLTRDVGFTPRYRLETGIRNAVDWWKANGSPRRQSGVT